MVNEDFIICEKGVYTRRNGINAGHDWVFSTKGITNPGIIADSVANETLLIPGQGIGLSQKICLSCSPIRNGSHQCVKVQYTYLSPFGDGRKTKTTNTAFIPLEDFINYPEIAYSKELFACCDSKDEFLKQENVYVNGEQFLHQNPIQVKKSQVIPMTIEEKLEKLGITITQLHFLAGVIFINSHIKSTNTAIHISGLPYKQLLPLLSSLLYQVHLETLMETRSDKFTNFDKLGVAIILDDNTVRFAQTIFPNNNSQSVAQIINPSKLEDYASMEKVLQDNLNNSLNTVNNFIVTAHLILTEYFKSKQDIANNTKTSFLAPKERQKKKSLLLEASSGLEKIPFLTEEGQLVDALNAIKDEDYTIKEFLYSYQEAKVTVKILEKIIEDFKQSLTNEQINKRS